MTEKLTELNLFDVKVQTSEREIEIPRRVIILSSAQLVKMIKTRYSTEGKCNIFPYLVDEYLNGDINSFRGAIIENKEMAEKDVSTLGKIIKNGEGIVILSRTYPEIIPVYPMIDGCRSSIILREIEFPVVITGKKYTDHGYVDINFKISGKENNITTYQRGKNYLKHADKITAISIALLAIGLGFFFARKGRFFELAIPMILLGGVLLYLRFFSQWGNDVFSKPQLEIDGNSFLLIENV